MTENSIVDRVYFWFADVPARSWYAHLSVSYAAWLLGALIGNGFGAPLTGGLIAAAAACLFYFVKEIRDAVKYWKKDHLGQVHRGATRRADGWGDFLGPFAVFLMALSARWLA